MARISTAIELTDRISYPLFSITNALHSTINAFEDMQQSANNSFDSSKFNEAKTSIDSANASIIAMTENIRKSEHQQENFNDEVRKGSQQLDSMSNKVLGVVAAYASFRGVQKIVEISDAFVSTTARLDLMNDGLQTTEELQNKIFASAQRSRAAYQDTADTVSKLGIMAGKAFSSNDEIIKFAELMNKNFIVGGSGQTEQAAAMYQLTQAMSSGRLQGDEYRSIIENAPLLAKAIEDYMINVEGAKGSMKEWAADGKLTANVIKAALFNTADSVNQKFAKMPMTWGQVWTSVCNRVLKASEPLLEFISFLADNWSVLEPIVLGVATALGIYTVALITYNAVTGISALAASVHAAALAMETGATFAATAAQYGFNAALLACPITWILLIIIAVIAAIYGIIAAINKVTGSSYSATGIIVGALTTALAFIWNLFVGLFELVLGIINFLINPFIELANFIGNVFTNPISSIIYLFQGMADNVLGVIEKIASALDFVFGSNMADTVSGWRTGLKNMADAAVAEYAPNENYEKVMDNMNLSAEGLGLKRWDYGDAWNTGYGAGENFANTVSGGVDDLLNGGINDIAANTGKMSDSVSASEEDLKYLRDLAEQETVNKFTTAEIKVDMTNNNNISSNMDIDGVVDKLTIGVNEAMEKAAEGVHI